MSFKLGLYDLFANIIPGFIYMFIFNETLRELKFTHFDVTQIDNLTYFLLLALFAYLVGLNMDYLAHRLWVRVFYRDHPEERAYKQIRAIYPELQIQFNPRHAYLLFDAIKYAKPELANDIEKNKVICLMLQNASFASILFFVSELIVLLSTGFSWVNLIIAIVSLLASIITLRRADSFNVLFYKMIFEHVSLFGDNLEEVINYSRNKSGEKESPVRKIRNPGRRKNDS